MNNTIHHKVSFGKIYYDEKGIVISTAFGYLKIRLPWSDFDFCSITPAVKKKENEWLHFQGTSLDQLTFLSIDFVVKNRHILFQDQHFLAKNWIKAALHTRPLYGSEDKALEKKGIISFDVNLKSLSVTRAEFISFLSTKITFDLIVYM